MFNKLLRWCKISAAGGDADQFPTQQITYLGKTADAYMLFPFGMHANVDPESLGLLHAVNGDDSNKAVLPLDPDNRPKPLATGEVAFYHPTTGSLIHFRANGDLDIDTVKAAEGNVNVNTAKAIITANDSVKIDTPLSTFTGNVQIDGKLDVDGNITSLANVIATLLLSGATLSITGAGASTISGTISSNGKDIGDTHTHGGSPTAPTGAVSNTGAPV